MYRYSVVLNRRTLGNRRRADWKHGPSAAEVSGRGWGFWCPADDAATVFQVGRGVGSSRIAAGTSSIVLLTQKEEEDEGRQRTIPVHRHSTLESQCRGSQGRRPMLCRGFSSSSDPCRVSGSSMTGRTRRMPVVLLHPVSVVHPTPRVLVRTVSTIRALPCSKCIPRTDSLEMQERNRYARKLTGRASRACPSC